MNTIIEKLIVALLNLLPKDILKKSLLELLSKLEKEIKESRSKFDDALILPLLNFIRKELEL